MDKAQENYRLQRALTAATVALFLIKTVAWYLTGSVAILTDTLEYTINVFSGFVGMYSLYISSKPRDQNHPYGHGKVEFLSAAIEGTLMTVSAFFIVFHAFENIHTAKSFTQLDYGIYLVAFTAVANFGLGYIAIDRGKKNGTLALIATGKHMQSDTYATGGIIVGLILMSVTGKAWIDSVVAMGFALVIFYAGYQILRNALAGMMDEADNELLDKVVLMLQKVRRENWIDLHNLRIIKYGSTLHFDCHLTVPWYFNVHEAHKELDELEGLVKEHFGESVELFVHADACLDFSCQICSKEDCPVRKADFVKQVDWTQDNIYSNKRHSINNA